MHEPIHLHITHAQLSKIRQGHPIQIPHAHIGHPRGHVFRNLHPETYKKLVRAYHRRKGARVHITPPELEGTGLLDVVKKVGRFIGQHKNVLKPLASAVLDTGAHFIPQFAPAREGIRKYTGVGIRPTHFVGQPLEGYGESYAPIEGYGEGMHFAVRKPKKRKAPRRKTMRGVGIIPAGYSGF